MELWSCSSWKCPLRSWSPAVPPALLRPPLTYVPKFHIRTVFKSLQGWELYPGQPVQGLDMDSLSTKKFLPISYLNLPWHNLRLFSSCPVSCLLGAEPDSTLLSGHCGDREGPPESPFLWMCQSLPRTRFVCLQHRKLNETAFARKNWYKSAYSRLCPAGVGVGACPILGFLWP